jgi:hypothetical protein
MFIVQVLEKLSFIVATVLLLFVDALFISVQVDDVKVALFL